MPDGPTRNRSLFRKNPPSKVSNPSGTTAGRPTAPTGSTGRARATEVYSIDTPPPTVSGSLHIGHVFSYTHTDVIARFQRMRGKAVFYPMGGTTTDCRPSGACRTTTACAAIRRCRTTRAFSRRTNRASRPISVSRPNFIELCNRLTAEDEKAFEHLWRHLGLSVDWSKTYATIDRRSQRVSQTSFLRLLKRAMAYQLEAPTLWDIDFRTAVAQAELEDREQPGAYHRIRFARPGRRRG